MLLVYLYVPISNQSTRVGVLTCQATFIATEPIVQDLGIKTTDAAWVLGTYSLAFASTLLFAGRIADLYAPNRVFTIGFIGIAVFYLVISFLTEQYSFFVLRALSALLAVLTIPR
jgi:MFS family permease